jgi:hypothetical protein
MQSHWSRYLLVGHSAALVILQPKPTQSQFNQGAAEKTETAIGSGVCLAERQSGPGPGFNSAMSLRIAIAITARYRVRFVAT